jgi:hypothetical protein
MPPSGRTSAKASNHGGNAAKACRGKNPPLLRLIPVDHDIMSDFCSGQPGQQPASKTQAPNASQVSSHTVTSGISGTEAEDEPGIASSLQQQSSHVRIYIS